ncbi:MAG: GTPase Era, partial [Calditrichaeota bacterium]
PERFFVSELIREQIFRNYGDEIPYSTTVSIEEFKERDGRKDYIRATILAERSSQKAILIGKKGQALKKVGEASRKEIEAMLEREVFLDLFVSVRPKWRDKEGMLRNLGYK